MVTRITAPAPAEAAGEAATELGGFADLAGLADQVEGRAPPAADIAPTPDPAAAAIDEAAQVVEIFASLALPFAAWRWGPEIPAAYGPKQRADIAQALGGVALKRGWSIGGAMAGIGPELALLAALAGPALPFIMAKLPKPGEPAPGPAALDGGPVMAEPIAERIADPVLP